MPTSQLEDTSVIDLINEVQMFYTESDVSSAALFNFGSNLLKGPFKKKDVALKEKTKITVGPLSLVISEVGAPEYQADEYPLSVTLQSSKRFDTLEKVVFYDEAGQEIESSSGGSSESRFMGSVTATETYNLTKKVDKATIVFTFWKDWKEVRVPFSVTTSIGL